MPHFDAPADDRLARFDAHRPLLFSIAYRMLGTSADAEDVLQDAYLRWQRADLTEVRSAKDFLSATVTRLAIDHLRSARVRREVYVGPWLPEPLVGVDDRDPLATASMAESLSTAFLVLLERLTPAQRAAFLLREVFDFEYPEIARILDISQANARQLVQRGKQHIAKGRPRFRSNAKVANDLAHQFLAACTTGDTGTVLSLLAKDAVAYADGGGKFAAARHPVSGADHVARFVVSVVAKWQTGGSVTLSPVNGGPGLLFHTGGRLRAVMTVARSRGKHLDRVFLVMNPDKLGATTPTL